MNNYIMALKPLETAPEDWQTRLHRTQGVAVIKITPSRAYFAATEEGLALVTAEFSSVFHIESIVEREPQSPPPAPLRIDGRSTSPQAGRRGW